LDCRDDQNSCLGIDQPLVEDLEIIKAISNTILMEKSKVWKLLEIL